MEILLVVICAIIGIIAFRVAQALFGTGVAVIILVLAIYLTFGPADAEAAELTVTSSGSGLAGFACMLVGLVTGLGLAVLYRASGSDSKAKYKIRELPNTNWGVYKRGRITGIWWKQDEKSFETTAQAYVRRRVHPKTTTYDSQGNLL